MISNDSPKQIKVSLYNLAILMHNMLEAKAHPKIGDMEVDRTLDEFIHILNKEVVIPTEQLEVALFYSNMLSENEAFWHPKKHDFPTLVSRVLREELEFDFLYNLIYYKGKGKQL